MKTRTETVKYIYFDEHDLQELILNHKKLENEVKVYNEKNNLNLPLWGFMMMFASRSPYDFLERFSFIPFIGKAWKIAKEELAENDDEMDEKPKWVCDEDNLNAFVRSIMKTVLPNSENSL